jgi:hypothetical protein
MKNELKFLFICLAIFMAFACDSFVTLTIRNNTSRVVYAFFSYDSIPNLDANYFDYYMSNTISPGKNKTESLRGTYNNLSTQYVTLFIYETDTLTKYKNTVFINTNKLYSRKITYSLSDLKKMNWQVDVK